MLLIILVVTTRAYSWGVVHPICVYLGEDNVSWLLRFALYGVYIYSTHHNFGQVPYFLGVSIMRVTTTPCLMWPLEYGKNLTFDG